MEESRDSQDLEPRPAPRATVYYDGQCPLCRREIAHYRRREGSERVEWIDITRSPDILAAHGLAYNAAMARFHVRDGEGRWHTGAEAFAELWSHLQGLQWLARGLRTLGALPALDRLYSSFARKRLRRRSGRAACDTCAKPRRPPVYDNSSGMLEQPAEPRKET